MMAPNEILAPLDPAELWQLYLRLSKAIKMEGFSEDLKPEFKRICMDIRHIIRSS